MYSSHYLKKGDSVFPYSLLIGSVFCLLLLGFFSIKIFSSTFVPSQGEKDNDKNIFIVSNVSSNTVSIVWETTEPEHASLILFSGNNKIGDFTDDRDVEKLKTKRKYHYVTLRGLESQTTYRAFVQIDQKDERSIEFSTRAVSETHSKPLFSYGKISDDNINERAIILLEFKGYNPISTLTSLSSEWLLSMHLLTAKNRDNRLLKNNDRGTFIILQEFLGSKIQKISYDNFIQEHTLANNRNLQGDIAGIKTTKEVTNKQSNLISDESISILIPVENASLDGSKPIFKGVARPGQRLKVMIKPGEGNIYEMFADSKGNWSYVPYFGLQNGQYEFTISSQDGNIPVTKFRTFTILKSGESVLGEATGSAQLTITVTPTEVLRPTMINEPTPTIIVQPSPTIGLIASPTISNQITPIIQEEPVSGFDIRLFGIMSTMLIFVGTVLFIFL
jgi:hypothetical protein